MMFSLPKQIRKWLQSSSVTNLVDWRSIRRSVRRPSIRCNIAIPSRLSLLSMLVALALIAATLLSPITFLPSLEEAGPIIGTLLTAQAAIAALSLAVTLFLLQGVRTRQDIDDRLYREYIRESEVQTVLWSSLLFVVVTASILLLTSFNYSDDKTFLPNALIAASIACLSNIVLPYFLFEKAVSLSRPAQWTRLRQQVRKADVRNAIHSFLRRHHGAADNRQAKKRDSIMHLPDPLDGSANEAIRALLEDALRAMSERRHDEFKTSIDLAWELVQYAMKELAEANFQWSRPGSQATWPPLRELDRNIYSFREAVIREGSREYILELLILDYNLTITGIRTRCGELFTSGLSGYQSNYQIVTRISGHEHRELLRDRFYQNAASFLLTMDGVEAIPYIQVMIGHQERLLADAMQMNQPIDYSRLHKGFANLLQTAVPFRRLGDSAASEASRLNRQYRIALMGLAGRSIFLDNPDEAIDINPYLEAARLAYRSFSTLADDLAYVLTHDYYQDFALWRGWEMEDIPPFRFTFISPEKYPLKFFTLRLIELSSDSMSSLDMHGVADRVFAWFMDNADSIEKYVQTESALTLQQRRKLATDALDAAVHRDRVAEDYNIIGRNLSEDRVATFKSEVRAAALSNHVIERIFKNAGSFMYLSGDALELPEYKAIKTIEHKGFLTDSDENSHTAYGQLHGDQWGKIFSDYIFQTFCERLDESPRISASLDSPSELLQAIDRAMDDLQASGEMIVVLAGNWSSIEVGLLTEKPDAYRNFWRMPESDSIGETGRYRGHPILHARDYSRRCVYVVEPARWGHFVRAPAGGDQDLRITIRPISAIRAREMIKANPNHFASEPDEESRIRKLRTYVEIEIGARFAFRVTDIARSCRIDPIH